MDPSPHGERAVHKKPLAESFKGGHSQSAASGSSRALQNTDIDSPCRFSVWGGRRLASGARFSLRQSVRTHRAVNNLGSVKPEFHLFLPRFLRYGRRTR